MVIARGVSKRLVLVVAAVMVLVGATACEPVRPVAKDRPVIMVHGWSALGAGVNCQGSFGTLSSSLRSDGFTGSMVTVGFYDSDSNCSTNLRDSTRVTGISNSTAWKTLAKAFSWYVYDTYTSNGIAVDLVGHSMGGLITRGAVYGSQTGQSGFSPPLRVEDSVTLAAPHQGAAWYSYGCFWGQCSQLKPGASDIVWVNQNGNPQGTQGTEWTVFGSTDDDTVPDESALSMAVPDTRKVRYTNLEHGDYQQNPTSIARIARALAEASS